MQSVLGGPIVYNEVSVAAWDSRHQQRPVLQPAAFVNNSLSHGWRQRCSCSAFAECHTALRFRPVALQYTIDSSLAVEQSRRAIVAMIVSAVVTCAFLLLRFGPGFSAAGFISLASAGLFAICCFAMGGYEVRRCGAFAICPGCSCACKPRMPAMFWPHPESLARTAARL